VVFLWWFCLTTFDQAFRPRRAVLAVGLGWLVIASADRGLLGPVFADRGLSWVLVAIGFGVIAHLAWRVMRDRAGDLVEVRRDARIVVVVLLAGLLLAELAKEVVFGIEWRPRLYTMAQNLALLAFAAWLLALVLRVSTESLAWTAGSAARPEAATPAVAGVSSPGEARLLARVRELIEVERVHLDPGMTFDAFVRRTGAPERAVRQLINHRLGHDHFRSFLNAHRTAEARRLLGDPGRAGDKLIAIAQDSGFASLASFNRAFLAVEGRAPSIYRAGSGGAAFRPQSGF
jgi:AraC-like DNA-binding protein